VQTIRERIDAAPMSARQWIIVILCVMVNAQDGFDVSAVAYGATGITNEWGISGAELGTIISAGLIGVVVGSFLLAPVADWLGRRSCLVICLSLTGAGMLMGSLSESPLELTMWRFITGLGIGGINGCINVVVTEYSNSRLRGFCIGIYAAGFGIGATVGGIAAATLLAEFGWRLIFAMGAINSLFGIILVLWLMPESIEFTIQKNGKKALERVNKVLQKINLESVNEIDSIREINPESSSEKNRINLAQVRGLFDRSILPRTLLLWAAFFCALFAFYFLTSWTPRLVVLSGGAESLGAIAGTFVSIGGSVGAVAFGFIALKMNPSRLILIFSGGGALIIVLFGASMREEWLIMGLGFLAGMFANGSIAALFALAPALYPVRMRVTGVGWAQGVGRSGAVLAPAMAGVLVDLDWSVAMIFLPAAGFLVLLMVTMVVYSRIDIASKNRTEDARMIGV
jgi:benzoate transport